MSKYICIHSHFYQPPRENPWLGEVERQESASPYHDWNARITDECYLPNTESPILDECEEIIKKVNNYERLSFNFGATLLSWMQRHKPDVYKSIIDADKKCLERSSGHGSAIAQVYNHIIMPLANKRDKQTQVVWGIKDFVSRFNRYPEGMWLSETAVDTETLEVLAENGIKFTILAPRQARYVRKIGDKAWNSICEKGIDTTMPYVCCLPSGKEISIFFYNGSISQGIAYGNVLRDGEGFTKKLLAAFSEKNNTPQLVNIAVDGETFGHHHQHGNMALAYCFDSLENNKSADLTVYGEFLEKHPPSYEVKIVENSSWSCEHGVERWRGDCGCCTGSDSKWNQKWRADLREAMDILQADLAQLYTQHMPKYLNSPWQARDGYIDILLDMSRSGVEKYLKEHGLRELTKREMLTALKLLEMQKCAMFMYTSCGWFFDDISRIEAVQIMQYAARAMQIAYEVSGMDFEAEFLSILKNAKSNVSEFKTGDKVYETLIKPAIHVHENIRLLESFLE